MHQLFDARSILFFISPFFLFVILGCAQGYCYNRGDNSKSMRTPSAGTVTDRRVFVFQQDGSKQCSETAGASVEDMATKLKDIKIYSKEKKSDGRMHITLCGSPTGKINVYEIDEADLPKAKAAQFEELR